MPHGPGHCSGYRHHSYRAVAQCRICWLAHRSGRTIKAFKPLRLDCIHLGIRHKPPVDPLGNECSCAGKEVWSCDIHGRCTKATKFEGVACCAAGTPNQCGDYDDGIELCKWVRHLAYHIYPVAGNNAWQWNVDQLCRRIDLFNGKRIVAIVTDPPKRGHDPTNRVVRGCDSPDAVKARFGEHAKTIEFIEMGNDPALREVVPFVPMLERMPNGPNDVMLYAQAKGTTRHGQRAVRLWTDALYCLYLDYWPVIEEALQRLPCVGAFKKQWRDNTRWHFDGSWIWYRSTDLFARDWRKINQYWTGVETYQADHFASEEAISIFHESGGTQLYSIRHWQNVLNRQLNQWKREHEGVRTRA